MKGPSGERPHARGLRVVVLRSRFNAAVVDGLVAGAGEALLEMGLDPDALAVVDVPGAFELPLAAKAAAKSGRFDAVVALGSVIRGETDHYEHIARETASGLAAVARETGVPVAFGVLTVEDEGQALARSAPGPGNKGAEAARAAVAMVHVLKRLTEATETQRTQRTRKKNGKATKGTTGRPGSGGRKGKKRS